VYFQVHGSGCMADSLPFRRFAESCLNDGATHISVDLRHCCYLDSTFLGTLLQLQKASRKHKAEMTLVSPSSECRSLLHQIGVHDLFTTVTIDEPNAGNWLAMDGVANVNDFNDNVLAAHEELATLGGKSGECFKRVASCLKEDMQRQAKPG